VHAPIPPAIKVTRPAEEIQALAEAYAREKDSRVKKRMEHVLNRCDGLPVIQAAKVERVSRNTPTNWVRRFNAGGIAGLVDRPRPGPAPKMSHGAIDKVVLSPPKAFGYMQEAWTLTLLWHAIMDVCRVFYSKSRLCVILNLLDYRRIVPRTESAAASHQKQRAWRETEGARILRDYLDCLWVQDETTARVATKVRKVLAKKGQKPVVHVKVGAYDQKVNVFISWYAKTGRVVVTYEDSLEAGPTKHHLRKVKKLAGKGRVHVLWDGNGNHVAIDVLRYAEKAGIHFHRFPTHSPRMSPVEEVNRQLKAYLSLKIFANREALLAEIKRFFRDHHHRFTLDLAAYIGPQPTRACTCPG
jgi:transposase